MKTINFALSILLSLLIFTSCASTTVSEASSYSDLTSLEFCILTDVEISLDSASADAEGYIRLTKKGNGKISEEELVLFSEDESIASIEPINIASYLIKYKISAHSIGETYVCAMNKDGTVISSKLKVTVSSESGIFTDDIDTKADTSDVIEVGTETVYNNEVSNHESVLSAEESAAATELLQDDISNTQPSSESPTPSVLSESSYILNTSTKKIHHKSCSYASQIKSENYGTTDDPDSMLAQGYAWCKKCHK